MTQRKSESIILSALVAAWLFACGNTKSEEPATEAAPPKAASRADEAPPSTSKEPSQAAQAAIYEALAEYETIRAKLAADETSGLADAATKIASAAARAAAAASPHVRPHLEAMAAEATRLGETGSDIEQIRMVFGEVSRAVVGLLVAEQALRRGRFVFHCPMAKGYKKWVQIDGKLENPFMGRRMLECGTKSEWEV